MFTAWMLAAATGLNVLLALWLVVLVRRLATRAADSQKTRSAPAASAAGITDRAEIVSRAADGLTPQIHLRSVPTLPLADGEQAAKLAHIRADVRERARGHGLQSGEAEEAVMADDLACCRYLVARRWDVAAAASMLYGALEWRVRRTPPRLLIDLDSADGRFLLSEGETGKVRSLIPKPFRQVHNTSVPTHRRGLFCDG